MKLKLDKYALTVTREKGDPSYPPMSKDAWGTPESRLLYHILKALNKRGYDLIKKRMWKDGHLVSEDQLYLRTRSRNSHKPHLCIWNGSFSIYDAARHLMEHGGVTLMVERNIFS